ncbi:transglycosylase domain-containing protein [Nesterenkonia massiliensis]|uniref:transglycosylase domain-containing protein n=1 Tax=Nesterenkonia massiliensis TaxID=1232429 RepID=UPI0005C9AF6D|nr:transglycosylase domain-containing protein [Nesterenkonia massiliensis]
MASRKSPLFDTATTVGKIMSFLGVSALCGLLAAGLVFPLAATGGAAATAGSDVLEEIPTELSEEPLSTPTRVYASDGETLIATFYEENRQPVSSDGISQYMKDAIVAIEDERFYEHGGVDARGAARALVHNLTSSTQQGASTLTMQYVNNVLNNAAVVRGEGRVLFSGINDKTYADKLREMKLAVAVEQEMTKDEILEGYLNIVLLGGQTYGVEAAAQYYWGIPASELNLQQSATLAGMVQSPNYFNPEYNQDNAKWRRNVVLDNMLSLGYITEEEHREAREAELGVDPHPQPHGCAQASFANYFCDFVQRQVLANEAFGEDEEARKTMLYRGGLDIVTTLDADTQRAAEDEVMATVPPGDDSGAVASIISVEPNTGNIVAMAQSTEYDPDRSFADGATTLNMNVGPEFGGGPNALPVGSTLKPFVAAAWVEQGGSMNDIVDATGSEFEQGDWVDASCLPGGGFRLGVEADSEEGDMWSVENVGENMNRRMSIDHGLYNSVNTATLATAFDMDMCDITDLTDRLDIVRASDGEGMNPSQPSFTVGGTELAPLTLASAYTVFANDGVQCEERVFLEITDWQGNSYPVPEEDCSEKLDADVVAQVNDTLVNIAERSPTNNSPFPAGNPPFPMLGKTGTSGENSHTWFAGSTKGLTSVAQIGRLEDIQSLNERRIGNQGPFEWFYGSSMAQPMWYEYIEKVGRNYDTGDFRESPNSEFDNRRESYPRSGALPGGRNGGSSNNGDNDSGNNDSSDEDDNNDDDD